MFIASMEIFDAENEKKIIKKKKEKVHGYVYCCNFFNRLKYF